jgi:predicted nucleic acid-binding protein
LIQFKVQLKLQHNTIMSHQLFGAMFYSNNAFENINKVDNREQKSNDKCNLNITKMENYYNCIINNKLNNKLSKGKKYDTNTNELVNLLSNLLYRF